jgi:antitoxin component YwqK of YwqJK toxin-antitoxin module
MLGFRVIKTKSNRYMITLEIPSDALTNIKSSDILVQKTATYIANMVKVISIEDKGGKMIPTITAPLRSRSSISRTFTVGEIIKLPEPKRIKFFLDKHVAEQYKRGIIKNGYLEKWHSNGCKMLEGIYKNGKKHGTWKYWDSNGNLYSEIVYKDGIKEPLKNIM